MTTLGVSLTLWLWSILGACVVNEMVEWRRDRLEREREGAWVVWLCVTDTLWRVK